MHLTQLHKPRDLDSSQNSVPFFQPKLTINEPNDIYEHEADTMAEKVMLMHNDHGVGQTFFKPSLTPIQRKYEHCEEDQLQRRELNTDGVAAGTSTENYLSDLNGKGRSLTHDERSFFEPRFGYDFSNVQLHTNSEANQSAKNINALAFTHKDHIVFGTNQYQPGTDSGKRLMAHELTHVIQQSKLNSGGWLHRKFDFTQPAPQKNINPVTVKYNQDTGSRDQEKISLGLTTSTVNGSLTSTVGDIKRLLDLRLTGNENPPGTFTCSAFSNGSVPVSARELILIAANASGKWTGVFPNYPERSCAGKTNIPVTIQGDPDAPTIEQRVLDNENEHANDIKQTCTDLNAELDAMSRITGNGNSEAACKADLLRKIGKGADPANAFGMAFRNKVIADRNRRDNSGSHTLKNRRAITQNCSGLTFVYKI